MIITDLFSSKDACHVCGQTPCNCTHIAESTSGVQSNIDTNSSNFNHLLYMLRNDYPVPRGRLLNKVMMNGQWLDPDDIRELVQKNQLWANLGFGQEGYNARGVGPGEGDHVVAEATGTLARTRDRLGLDAVPLQDRKSTRLNSSH